MQPDEKENNVVALDQSKRKGGDDWKALLKFQRGRPTPTLANAVLILQRAPEWGGVLGYDELAGRVQLLRLPPVHHIDGAILLQVGDYWTDRATDKAIAWCERLYDVAFPREIFMRAVEVTAESRSAHPVRKYLEGLRWDSTPRMDSWLSDIFRVDAGDYVATVGAKWLISAVARAYAPGCKVDNVLIIEGAQRAGKSRALRLLCANERWFLETGLELGSKDALQIIRNKWLVELAELDSLSRSEISRVKAFITAQIDTYRASYGRLPHDQPRSVVFVGTTNDKKYLKDDTGGGRWWPVWSPATQEDPIPVEKVVGVRDQLWAEAVVRYKAGHAWHLEGVGSIRAAQVEQEARRQEDPWEELLEPFLKANGKRGVTVADVLRATGADPFRCGKTEAMKAARILNLKGWWVGKVLNTDGKRSRLYFPPSKK